MADTEVRTIETAQRGPTVLRQGRKAGGEDGWMEGRAHSWLPLSRVSKSQTPRVPESRSALAPQPSTMCRAIGSQRVTSPCLSLRLWPPEFPLRLFPLLLGYS
ncbi:unnamed protein product [Lota lota]